MTIHIPVWLMALAGLGLFVWQWLRNVEELRRHRREEAQDRKIDQLTEMVGRLFSPAQRKEWMQDREFREGRLIPPQTLPPESRKTEPASAHE